MVAFFSNFNKFIIADRGTVFTDEKLLGIFWYCHSCKNHYEKKNCNSKKCKRRLAIHGLLCRCANEPGLGLINIVPSRGPYAFLEYVLQPFFPSGLESLSQGPTEQVITFFYGQ